MTENKYLPTGSIIAQKYEVVDILGEDAFEILYLVRTLQKKGSFFILKELFLETFSSREKQNVVTIPEAEGVFNKRKKQIIEEVERQKVNQAFSEIKVYGYEEENGTIYTVMEFSNNANLEKYLHYTFRDDKLPTLNELLRSKRKKRGVFFYFKALLILFSVASILFYFYEFFYKKELEDGLEELETSLRVTPPKLRDRVPIVEKKSSMEIVEEPLVSKSTTANQLPDYNSTQESNRSLFQNGNELNLSLEKELFTNRASIQKEENRTLLIEKEQLEKRVSLKEDLNETAILQRAIKSFLDEYIEATATLPVASTLKYYEKRLKRYFKIDNATYADIIAAQERYNKKWVKREFKITDFEIVKSYERENEIFYDIKTTTIWKIKNREGKTFLGKSRGFMELKKTYSSFKITSIYAID